MKLSDRLNPRSFADDEVVGVAAVDRDIPTQDIPEADWVFVPERLFLRLLSLGQAYSLHFASQVDSQTESTLDSTQCEWFIEELRFLDGVVTDPAFSSMLKEIVPKVEHVLRYSGASLRFSPP